MGHSRGDSPEIGEPFGDLQLRADALARLEVLEFYECSHARVALADRLDTYAHTPRRAVNAGQHRFGGIDSDKLAILHHHRFAHIMIGRKNIFRAPTKKLVRRRGKKTL